mmetsp:Transcript_26719/g.32928  ORF Transcript_26719/g.32928 Transcript_26719/m.32928 type:complete len:94 (-) Transcript_26719:1849-2130(-)
MLPQEKLHHHLIIVLQHHPATFKNGFILDWVIGTSMKSKEIVGLKLQILPANSILLGNHQGSCLGSPKYQYNFRASFLGKQQFRFTIYFHIHG